MKYLLAVFALLYSGMVSADTLTIIMRANPNAEACEETRVMEGQVCSAIAVVVKEPDAIYDAICLMTSAEQRLCYILRTGKVKKEGAAEIYPADIHLFTSEDKPKGAKL